MTSCPIAQIRGAVRFRDAVPSCPAEAPGKGKALSNTVNRSRRPLTFWTRTSAGRGWLQSPVRDMHLTAQGDSWRGFGCAAYGWLVLVVKNGR